MPRSAGAHVRPPHAHRVETITLRELAAWAGAAFLFGLSLGVFLWAP